MNQPRTLTDAALQAHRQLLNTEVARINAEIERRAEERSKQQRDERDEWLRQNPEANH